MVVRSHLALEVILNRVLERSSPNGKALDRLPFMAKVDVSIAFGAVSPDLRPGYVIANRIRNRFAHQLDAELLEGDAADFIASFDPSSWDGFMFRSYVTAARESPHERVAFGFATLFVYSGIESKLLPDLIDAIARSGARQV